MCKILFLALSCLTLKIQAQIDSTWINGTQVLADGYYKADKSTFTNLLVIDFLDSTEYYFVNTQLEIPISKLESAAIMKNYSGSKFIALTFEPTSHSKWTELTSSQVGKNLVLMINNKLVQGSIVNGEIPNGVSAINRNDLTETQLTELLALIIERLK